MIRFARYVITLSLPLLMIALALRLLMTPVWLSWLYQREGFSPDYYGFTAQDRLAYAPLGIDYLLNGYEIAFLERQRLEGQKCFPPQTSECPMFNPRELRHMQDVQGVVALVFNLAYGVGVIFVIAFAYLLRRRDVISLRNALLHGSMLVFGSVVSVAVLAMTAWDIFFEGFHALFFESDTWRFYYSDTLIRLYPEQFWFESALALGALALLLAGVVGGMCWRWSPHTRTEEHDV
jgi:integral membrane protein (TIGR01906 family)